MWDYVIFALWGSICSVRATNDIVKAGGFGLVFGGGETTLSPEQGHFRTERGSN